MHMSATLKSPTVMTPYSLAITNEEWQQTDAQIRIGDRKGDEYK